MLVNLPHAARTAEKLVAVVQMLLCSLLRIRPLRERWLLNILTTAFLAITRFQLVLFRKCYHTAGELVWHADGLRLV